jgi:hypothetical protein
MRETQDLRRYANKIQYYGDNIYILREHIIRITNDACSLKSSMRQDVFASSLEFRNAKLLPGCTALAIMQKNKGDVTNNRRLSWSPSKV